MSAGLNRRNKETSYSAMISDRCSVTLSNEPIGAVQQVGMCSKRSRSYVHLYGVYCLVPYYYSSSMNRQLIQSLSSQTFSLRKRARSKGTAKPRFDYMCRVIATKWGLPGEDLKENQQRLKFGVTGRATALPAPATQ